MTRVLIRGGISKGISSGLASVISVILVIGCFFVYNSKRIMPSAHISTFEVGSSPLKTSGAL